MKLTIICASLERQSVLQRFIRYWSVVTSSTSLISIIVVDGSSQPLQLSSVSENITYIHKVSPLVDRLRLGLAYAQTPYIAFVPDDEFFILSSLLSMINFLDLNIDYGSVYGVALSFEQFGHLIRFSPAYTSVATKLLTSDIPEERLRIHFSDYTPSHIYSVCRKKIAENALDFAANSPFTTLYGAFEYLYESFIVLKSKSKFMPNVFWLRSQEKSTPPIRNTGEAYLDPSSPFKYMWRKSLSQPSNKLRHNFALYYCKHIRRSRVSSILDSFDIFCSTDRPHAQKTIYKTLVQLFPWVFKISRIFYCNPILRNFLVSRYNNRTLCWLNDHGIAVNPVELRLVSSFVTGR